MLTREETAVDKWKERQVFVQVGLPVLLWLVQDLEEEVELRTEVSPILSCPVVEEVLEEVLAPDIGVIRKDTEQKPNYQDPQSVSRVPAILKRIVQPPEKLSSISTRLLLLS